MENYPARRLIAKKKKWIRFVCATKVISYGREGGGVGEFVV